MQKTGELQKHWDNFQAQEYTAPMVSHRLTYADEFPQNPLEIAALCHTTAVMAASC
jgi:hypothetical protein